MGKNCYWTIGNISNTMKVFEPIFFQNSIYKMDKSDYIIIKYHNTQNKNYDISKNPEREYFLKSIRLISVLKCFEYNNYVLYIVTHSK